MSRDRLKIHSQEFLDAAMDAGAALVHMGAEIAAMLKTSAPFRANLMPAAAKVTTAEEISAGDALEFMALAMEEIQAAPLNLAPDGRTIEQVVKDFTLKHQGTPGVDLDGCYGPQSPDLITLYVREFQPGWLFTLVAAMDLWKQNTLPAGWTRVDVPTCGDIAVLEDHQFGNLGIVIKGDNTRVQVLTQYSGPRSVVNFKTYPVSATLGFYRWVGVPADA